MHTDLLRETFREQGYAAPIPLLGARECAELLVRLRAAPEPPRDWHKGFAASSYAYFAIATDARIRSLVTAVLGYDVLLWGASLVHRKPGHAHPWHTDIESADATAECASLWIGLAGTGPDSSLGVVSHSHRFGTPLQRAAAEHGTTRDGASDADVACWARALDRRAEIASLALADGDAVLFDGRLWHGSYNRSADRTRHALLLQFATPRTPIRMPCPARFAWPFESIEMPRPPCIVVAGRDAHGVNRVVAGPAAAQRGVPALQRCVHPVPLPLARDRESGWQPHPLFRGSTPNLRSVGCHVSVLEPGHQPHPPHTHAEDEILLVLDGEAMLVLEAGLEPIAPGTFSYYPAGFAHSIRNDSPAPVTYLMLKWRAERRRVTAPLEARRVRFLDVDARLRHHGDGFETKTILDGETASLGHLHAHVSTLRPGGGYVPHVDRHDVAIVVLAGTVDAGAERVGTNGVAYFAAGEPHGLRNAGDEPAVYLVFEFHGRRETPSRTRSLLGTLGRLVQIQPSRRQAP